MVGFAEGRVASVMLVNPLTYSTALLTALLTGSVADGSPAAATSFAVTIAFGIVLLAGSAALANQKTSSSSA